MSEDEMAGMPRGIEDLERMASDLSKTVTKLIENEFNGNVNHYLRSLNVVKNLYKGCQEVERSLNNINELLMRNFKPSILVFSTNTISDVAIDLAGLSHQHYRATTRIIRVPCSSMIGANLILYAFKCGFDAVFIAADGTDCPYLDDCMERTAKNVQRAYELLKEEGIEPERLMVSGICSVCTEAFVKNIDELYRRVEKLGPVGAKVAPLVEASTA